MVNFRLLRRGIRTTHIFAGALSVFLAISYYFVLPVLASVQTNNVTYSLDGLKAYVAELDTDVARLEKKREQLLQPVQIPQYYENLEKIQPTKQFVDFADFVFTHGAEFTLSNEQLVTFSYYSVQRTENQFLLQFHGIIHSDNVNAQQILNEFVLAVTSAYPDFVLQKSHLTSTSSVDTSFTLYFALAYDK